MRKPRETSTEAIAIIQVKDSGQGWGWKEEDSVQKSPEVEEVRLKLRFSDVSIDDLGQIKVPEPLNSSPVKSSQYKNL